MQRMLSYPGIFARLSIICVSSKCGLQELGLWGSDRQFQSFRWVVFREWPCIPKIAFQKCGLSHLCKAFSKVTTKQQRRHPGAFLVLIWSLIYCAGFWLYLRTLYKFDQIFLKNYLQFFFCQTSTACYLIFSQIMWHFPRCFMCLGNHVTFKLLF